MVVLSFLPPEIKHLLHTRGSLHYWAHVYLFAGVCVLLLDGAETFRSRLLTAAGLIAVGCTIEIVQTHGYWPFLEVWDVISDLIGVAMGALIGWMRSLPGTGSVSLDRLSSASADFSGDGWVC